MLHESTTALLNQQAIMSLKEARKILGVKARQMTDSEIRQELEAYDEIAALIIRNYSVPKTKAKST